MSDMAAYTGRTSGNRFVAHTRTEARRFGQEVVCTMQVAPRNYMVLTLGCRFTLRPAWCRRSPKASWLGMRCHDEISQRGFTVRVQVDSAPRSTAHCWVTPWRGRPTEHE
jgi:hypothetical protein